MSGLEGSVSKDKRRSLLPSRFERTIQDTEKQSVTVLSATSSGVQLGKGTTLGAENGAFPGGISIFTESLGINVMEDGAAAFSTKGCPLTVSAEVINVVSRERPAIISTKGTSGAVGTANNGTDGGSLNLYIRNVIPSPEKALELDAQGGVGGSPSAVSTGVGGNGGKGGSVTMIVRMKVTKAQTYLSNLKKEFNLPSRWKAKDEAMAANLMDGDPLLQATKQMIKEIKRTDILPEPELSIYLKPIEALLDMPVTSRKEPRDEGSGEPLRSIYRLTAAINEAITLSQKTIDDCRVELSSKINCRGGLAGKRGDLGVNRGERGNDGAAGSSVVEFLGPKNIYSISDVPFVFAHPLQCRMVLDKANIYYYLGSRENRKMARQLLESLLDRLSFATNDFAKAFQSDQVSQPLMKAFLAFWSSPREAQLQAANLRTIFNKATQLYMRLEATNIDYYGYPSEYVPRTSYEELTKLLKGALVSLDRAETAYLAYLSEKEITAKLDANRNVATARANEAIEKSTEDLKQLNEAVVKKYKTIADPTRKDAILAARGKAELAMINLKQVVDRKFTITPKSFLNGLASFASGPSVLSGVTQSASLVYEGFTTVPNLNGEPVSKDVIISKLKGGTSNVASLKAEMLAIAPKEDGSLTTDSVDTTKVVTTLEAISALVDDFADDAFGDSGSQCKAALEAYSELLIKRNGEIVEFNVMLKTITAEQEAIAALEGTKLRLQQGNLDSESNSLEDLASMTKLLEFILDSARQRCMRLLSFLQRALRYKTLSSVDFRDQAWNEQIREQPDTEEAALSMTSPVLRSMMERLSDQLFDIQELQAGDRSLFPSDFDKGGIGKLHHLSEAELNELLTTGSTNVQIPPVSDSVGDDEAQSASEFRGCADVRVYRVRFWLRGLKLRSGRAALGPSSQHSRNDRAFGAKLITTTITHTGSEVVVDALGKHHNFQHEPISVAFSYRLDEDGNYTIDDATGGDIVNFSSHVRGVNSVYAAPSPYTKWNISFRHVNTKEIDVSGVTGAVLEFLGSSRAFIYDR